jgi:hypothetical protein
MVADEWVSGNFLQYGYIFDDLVGIKAIAGEEQETTPGVMGKRKIRLPGDSGRDTDAGQFNQPCAALVYYDRTAGGAHPEPLQGIFTDLVDNLSGQPGELGHDAVERMETLAIEDIEALLGGRPDHAPLVLEDLVDVAAAQAIGYAEKTDLEI